MVMESLHGRFKERLKNKYELIFTAKHDHFDRIPFTLGMANLGTTLTEWEEELKLDSSRFFLSRRGSSYLPLDPTLTAAYVVF
jgi:hypothetical protein